MIRKGAERVATEMVKVSVELRSGTARFWVGVQAESISRALSMVGARYPRGEVGAIFPLEPEGLFVDGPAEIARTGETEHPRQLAA